MGATSTGVFLTREQCDHWAEAQKRLAFDLRLYDIRDFGNRAVLIVSGFNCQGQPEPQAISYYPLGTLEDRVKVWLEDMVAHYGWREDHCQPRERGYLRCLRFDS